MIAGLLLRLGQGKGASTSGGAGLLERQNFDASGNYEGKGAVRDGLVENQHRQIQLHLPEALEGQVHTQRQVCGLVNVDITNVVEAADAAGARCLPLRFNVNIIGSMPIHSRASRDEGCIAMGKNRLYNVENELALTSTGRRTIRRSDSSRIDNFFSGTVLPGLFAIGDSDRACRELGQRGLEDNGTIFVGRRIPYLTVNAAI